MNTAAQDESKLLKDGPQLPGESPPGAGEHKLVLVGDTNTGKTSMLVQFDRKDFRRGSFCATVGVGFTSKVIDVDGCKVKLQIWDTAGQERFRSITHAYYRDAQALLLLYDVTNSTSFTNIRAWLSEIAEYAPDDVIIMLLGNKADCLSERRVSPEEGESLAKDNSVYFMETSAKTGQNVELAFQAVARELRARELRKSSSPNGSARGNLRKNSDESNFKMLDYIQRERQQSETKKCPC